uniref:WSC domain-containing protein n=1 Tax=Bionectria ochroleuca TaxID=29856 RepID=A0A8H7NFD1_BIOOC
MDLELCAASCGSRFFGVAGTDCWCGKDIDSVGTARVPNNVCSIPCPGNQQQFCGSLVGLQRRQFVPNLVYLTVYIRVEGMEGGWYTTTTTTTATTTISGVPTTITDTVTTTVSTTIATTVTPYHPHPTYEPYYPGRVIICYGDYCLPQGPCKSGHCERERIVCKDEHCFPETCKDDKWNRLVECKGDKCHYPECKGEECKKKVICYDGKCIKEKCFGDECEKKVVCHGEECHHKPCKGEECYRKEECHGEKCKPVPHCKENCPVPKPPVFPPPCKGECKPRPPPCNGPHCPPPPCHGPHCPLLLARARSAFFLLLLLTMRSTLATVRSALLLATVRSALLLATVRSAPSLPRRQVPSPSLPRRQVPSPPCHGEKCPPPCEGPHCPPPHKTTPHHGKPTPNPPCHGEKCPPPCEGHYCPSPTGMAPPVKTPIIAGSEKVLPALGLGAIAGLAFFL